MTKKYGLVIASDSCNGEEEIFASWVNANYPDIEAKVGNVYRSTFSNMEGEVLEEEYELGVNLWDKYCSA